jgi:hypothetical protein
MCREPFGSPCISGMLWGAAMTPVPYESYDDVDIDGIMQKSIILI